MLRIRLKAPRGQRLCYSSMDLIHDGMIAMLTDAGAPSELLIGPEAALWSGGAIFPRKVSNGQDRLTATAVVVSTPDPRVAAYLSKADPGAMRSSRSRSGESVDLAGWATDPDPAPTVGGTSSLAAVCATPMAIGRRGDRSRGRWHFDFREVDAGGAVSARLSRLAGREVRLSLVPDGPYLSERSSHAVFSKVKADAGSGVVVGMVAPFVLSGSEADLELAWHAGLGEKTRMGFGIIAAA